MVTRYGAARPGLRRQGSGETDRDAKGSAFGSNSNFATDQVGYY